MSEVHVLKYSYTLHCGEKWPSILYTKCNLLKIWSFFSKRYTVAYLYGQGLLCYFEFICILHLSVISYMLAPIIYYVTRRFQWQLTVQFSCSVCIKWRLVLHKICIIMTACLYHTWVWNRGICRCVIVRPRSHMLIVRRKIVPITTTKCFTFSWGNW